MPSEPNQLLADIRDIIEADVTALKIAAGSRMMTSEEALTLKRYADILIEWQREQRKSDEEELGDMTEEELKEKAAELLGWKP